MKLTLKRKLGPATWTKRHWIGEYQTWGFPLKVGRFLAVDTETTGLDPWGKRGVDRDVEPARLFMVQLCNEDGECATVRFPVDAFTRKVFYDPRGIALLQEYLEDESTSKVMFNANFDERMLALAGIIVKGEILDALLGFHIQKPDELGKQLKPICKRYLEIPADDEKALDDSCKAIRNQVRYARARVKSGKIRDGDEALARYFINPSDEEDAYKADMWLADPELCRTYGERDAYRTMVLWLTCEAAFDADAEAGGRMWTNFRDEQECQRAIKAMEDRGIAMDVERTDEIERFYADHMENYLGQIHDEAGPEFNPSATEDRQHVFFAERGFKPLKYKKKKGAKEYTKHKTCKGKGCAACQGTGNSPQLDADFLQAIGVAKIAGDGDSDDRLVPKDTLAYNILHWSAAHTMHGFVRGYQEWRTQENGHTVIHPNLKQAGTATNRLSAEKPNLQNVADDDSGKKKANIPYRPRECFIPRNGHVMMLPDYSQIEVWILALRAKAPQLMSILQEGGDTHGRIASMIWPNDFDLMAALKSKKIDVKDLSKADAINLKTYTNRRKRSKNLQFCKIYGGGPGRIAEMIGDGCTLQQAKQFISDYDAALPEVAGFMKEKVGMARATGMVENGYGWRYPINPQLAYRAVNYDIQGTAACLMKRAMNRVHRLCQEKWADKMWLLLTIHDELMIEALKRYHSRDMMVDVVKAMQADWKFLGSPCPFPVGMKITETRWNEAKEVTL